MTNFNQILSYIVLVVGALWVFGLFEVKEDEAEKTIELGLSEETFEIVEGTEMSVTYEDTTSNLTFEVENDCYLHDFFYPRNLVVAENEGKMFIFNGGTGKYMKILFRTGEYTIFNFDDEVICQGVANANQIKKLKEVCEI